MGFVDNEISVKAAGGTELAKWSIAPLLPTELLDETQIISSRIRDLDPTKIRILWLHDLPEDPESSQLKYEHYRNQFHHIVFVSNWQYHRYQQVLGIPYSQNCSVIEVGIEAATPQPKPTDIIKLVYSSTPQRGLDILVPVFDELSKVHDNIELDVFSSYKIYGWPEADKPFQKLFDFCEQHPKINYRGFVPNSELRKSLETSHIFAYPSTWLETSCRALVEAMSAKLWCVHPNYGALTETSGGLTMMYNGDQDKNIHAGIFYNVLNDSIELIRDNPAKLDPHLSRVKAYTDSRFNLKLAAGKWNALIDLLIKKYPTPESRALPVRQEIFTYTA